MRKDLRRSLFAWAYCALMSLNVCATSPTYRIGVIGHSSSAAEADLLTVVLSQVPELEILDRSELTKVFAEAELQAIRTDTGIIAHRQSVLGADAVIFLEKAEDRVFLRLVASRTGIVLLEMSTDVRMIELDDWCKFVADRFRLLYPKLHINSSEAIFISSQGFYMSIPEPGTEKIEQTISTGLNTILNHRPELMLLDRENVTDLLWEQSILPQTENSFASANVMIRGTIEKKADGLRVRVQLSGPQFPADDVIYLEGSTAELDDLTQRIADAVINRLPVEKTNIKASREAEALKFFDLAKWANAHNLLHEAVAASESAAALGLDTLASNGFRILLFADLAYREKNPGRRTRLISIKEGYLFHYIDARRSDLHLRATERTLDLLDVHNSRYKNLNLMQLPRNDVAYAPIKLTPYALRPLLKLIRFYVDDDIYQLHKSRLDAIRERIAVHLEEHLGYRPRRNLRFGTDYLSDAMALVYSPYLYDDPQEVMRIIRFVITGSRNENDMTRLQRDYLGEERPGNSDSLPKLHNRTPVYGHIPPFVSWNGETEKALQSLWKSFRDELHESTSAVERDWARVFDERLGYKRVEEPSEQVTLDDAVWRNREKLLKAMPRTMAGYGGLAPSQDEVATYRSYEGLSDELCYKLLAWLLNQPAGKFMDPHLLDVIANREFTVAQRTQLLSLLIDYRNRNSDLQHVGVQAHMRFFNRAIGGMLRSGVESEYLKENLEFVYRMDKEGSVEPELLLPQILSSSVIGISESGNLLAIWLPNGPVRPAGSPDSYVYVVNLHDGSTRRIMAPIPQAPSQREGAGSRKAKGNRQILLTDHYLFWMIETRLLRMDLGDATWKELSLDGLHYRMTFSDPWLYLSYTSVGGSLNTDAQEQQYSGLLRYGANLGEPETIFSSRRRPAAHELDLVPPQSWYGIGATDGGDVWIAARNNLFKVSDDSPVDEPKPLLSTEGGQVRWRQWGDHVLAFHDIISNPQVGVPYRGDVVNIESGQHQFLFINTLTHLAGGSYRKGELTMQLSNARLALPRELMAKKEQEKVLITPALHDNALYLYVMRQTHELEVGVHHYIYRIQDYGYQKIPISMPFTKSIDAAVQKKVAAIIDRGVAHGMILAPPTVYALENGWILHAVGANLFYVPLKAVNEALSKVTLQKTEQ